jgi:hypothetical protein
MALLSFDLCAVLRPALEVRSELPYMSDVCCHLKAEV